MQHLNRNVDTRRVVPDATAASTFGLAAGTTDVNGPWIPLAGVHALRWLVALGAVVSTGLGTLGVQYSDDGSTVVATDATTVGWIDTDDNRILAVEIVHPLHAYARLTIDRGTANTTIDAIIAELSGLAKVPFTKDTTLQSETTINCKV